MRRSLKKIPLSVYPSFWALAILIALANGTTISEMVIWVGVVFVSVIIHEMGHAITAILFGQSVAIELRGLGGVTIPLGGKLSQGKEFVVVFMGPLFGFLLAGLAFIALQVPVIYPSILIYSLKVIYIANILWSILNLLPVLPLDGGRLMMIFFEKLFGHSGVKFSYLFSCLFSLFLSLAAFSFYAVIAGALFMLFAYEGYVGFQRTRNIVSESSENKLLDEIELAEKEWISDDQEVAVDHLRKIVDKKEKEGPAYIQAVQLLSKYLLVNGKPKEAYAFLHPLENKLLVDGLKLLQLASYEVKDFDSSLRAGSKVFIEQKEMDCALISAFSAACLNKVEETINWLSCVQGIDMDKVLNCSDFDRIRNDPLFREYLSKRLTYKT